MKVDALRDGITAGANIVRAEERLRREALARQIEKLSWMVEELEKSSLLSVEDCERLWLEQGR